MKGAYKEVIIQQDVTPLRKYKTWLASNPIPFYYIGHLAAHNLLPVMKKHTRFDFNF